MVIRSVLLSLIYAFLLLTSLNAAKIEIKNRQLYVNDRPFIIKGVCYDAIPVGQYESYEWDKIAANRDTITYDMKMINAMGANCIRTYKVPDISFVLDKAYENGLYVIIEIPILWNTNYRQSAVSNKILTDIEDAVNKWKDHPALLMWCVGHEADVNISKDAAGNLQMNSIATQRLQSWYPFLNYAAKKIHELESPAWHPVSYGEAVANEDAFGIWLGEVDTIGNPVFFADDAHMQYLDIWGTQTYQGLGMGEHYFSEYKSKSSKPLWIAETGCDAYDAKRAREDQKIQSQYITAQWKQIAENINDVDDKNTCVGVTFFSWVDGWYKATMGQPYQHNTNASWPNVAYGYDYRAGANNMNEEW